MRNNNSTTAKSVVPHLEDMLGILDRANQLLPLESLVLGLKKISPPAEARNSARWVATQIYESRPEISTGLTDWWLDHLKADSTLSPAEHAGELINALAIGRSAPPARLATHNMLEAYLREALQKPESAQKLLPSLPNLINQPEVLPDTRLRVFKCVQGQSASLMQLLPHTAAGHIQRLAEIAKIDWTPARTTPPTASFHAQKQSPGSSFIADLSAHNMRDATAEAALDLAQLDTTAARLDYLDRLQLQIAQQLKPQQQLHFLTSLHSRIMFQPDLVEASRQGVIEAFNSAAPSAQTKTELVEKLLPKLQHDGPLAEFLKRSAQQGQGSQKNSVPAPPQPWLRRLFNWIRPPRHD